MRLIRPERDEVLLLAFAGDTMRITFLLLILTARVLLGQSGDSVPGSICGSVLDENGSPASYVRVTAIREPGPGGSSIGFPFSSTDQFGRYCFHGLPLGEYVLSAFDEKKGYPHRGPAFYIWQTPDPKVKLSSLHPDASADWQIPFKAGWVDVELPDMPAGKPSQPIRFSFHVRSRSQAAVMSSEVPVEFRGRSLKFLLPPDEEVMLRVTCADGHIWPIDSGDGKSLLVHAGGTTYVILPTSCLQDK